MGDEEDEAAAVARARAVAAAMKSSKGESGAPSAGGDHLARAMAELDMDHYDDDSDGEGGGAMARILGGNPGGWCGVGASRFASSWCISRAGRGSAERAIGTHGSMPVFSTSMQVTLAGAASRLTLPTLPPPSSPSPPQASPSTPRTTRCCSATATATQTARQRPSACGTTTCSSWRRATRTMCRTWRCAAPAALPWGRLGQLRLGILVGLLGWHWMLPPAVAPGRSNHAAAAQLTALRRCGCMSRQTSGVPPTCSCTTPSCCPPSRSAWRGWTVIPADG